MEVQIKITLDEWQYRLLDEYKDLTIKIDRIRKQLEKFEEREITIEISEQRGLLCKQLEPMRNYAQILKMRLGLALINNILKEESYGIEYKRN